MSNLYKVENLSWKINSSNRFFFHLLKRAKTEWFFKRKTYWLFMSNWKENLHIHNRERKENTNHKTKNILLHHHLFFSWGDDIDESSIHLNMQPFFRIEWLCDDIINLISFSNVDFIGVQQKIDPFTINWFIQNRNECGEIKWIGFYKKIWLFFKNTNQFKHFHFYCLLGMSLFAHVEMNQSLQLLPILYKSSFPLDIFAMMRWQSFCQSWNISFAVLFFNFNQISTFFLLLFCSLCLFEREYTIFFDKNMNAFSILFRHHYVVVVVASFFNFYSNNNKIENSWQYGSEYIWMRVALK